MEKVLKEMQAATAGRLPVLEGFATSPRIIPSTAISAAIISRSSRSRRDLPGGSVVQVSVQVTAWYADPVAARSGYQLLTSNGRLEADLLDQLADQLAGKTPPVNASSPAGAAHKPFPSEESALAPSLPEQSLSQQSFAENLRPDSRSRGRQMQPSPPFRRRYHGSRKAVAACHRL